MGSNTEKKQWTYLQNSFKNWSKEIKSDNFRYRKVGRAITKWEAIEKNPILLSQYWKNLHIRRVTEIVSHSNGSNNIFAYCIYHLLDLWKNKKTFFIFFSNSPKGGACWSIQRVHSYIDFLQIIPLLQLKDIPFFQIICVNQS